MGQRGTNLEPPAEADLAEMQRMTTEAVRAGALGVSTSRNLAHRFRDGRLAPSVPTEDSEVLALARGLGDAHTGVFQMLPDTNLSPEAQFRLIERVARVSGRPVSFTLMQAPHQPDGWRTILDGLERANADGVRINAQVIARPTAALLGLRFPCIRSRSTPVSGPSSLIAPGYKADLNVIDMGRLHLHAPYVTYDLPVGGRRLSQKSDGYIATIVSGEVTYRGGAATGALPGRLIRGQRLAPA